MSKLTKKRQATTKLAMYLAEHGMKNFREYKRDKGRPVSVGALKTMFTSYNKMLMCVAQWEPELSEIATGETAAKAEYDVISAKIKEAEAAAAAKAEATEESDE